jgi:CubicO group peptidase (beta-lactamase class C family)
MTRYGEYPYPHYMRHGVYSVTKSMGAAIAMLRLAQKYSDEVFDLKLVEYVEIMTDHNGWNEVTFGDALNMATGIGESPPQRKNPNFAGDEFKPRFYDFIMARSLQEKLDVCFSYPVYSWGPGEVTRYNSINTFLLSAAMDRFFKNQEGPDVHMWDMLHEEVFKSIGIAHLPIMHTVEPNGSRGIPLMFMGLYPTVDDIAKITMLFQNGGQHNGEQILHPIKTGEALYRRGLSGFPTEETYPHGDHAYQLSFRGFPYRTTDGRFFQVPWMAGAGGNTVVVAPNGISGFVLTDANIYVPDSLVQVLETIRPFPGEGIRVDRLLLLPEKIRLLPETRRFAVIIDRGLLIGLILIAVTVTSFIYTVIHKKRIKKEGS